MNTDQPVDNFGDAVLDQGLPSLGRIVFYHPIADRRQLPQASLPAIVTCVHDCHTGDVNLKVFCDGVGDVWVPHVFPGIDDGQWAWPPRN